MIEQHDYDKLKQEEADEIRQKEENRLFKAIEPYIDGLNNAIKQHCDKSLMTEEECAEYVRETIFEMVGVGILDY